jgi:hypothetical protein
MENRITLHLVERFVVKNISVFLGRIELLISEER